jgi:hypothetical protein
MAATKSSKSSLTATTANFNAMLNGFGIVTVMNAKVYEPVTNVNLSTLKATEILEKYQTYDATTKVWSDAQTPLCTLETLKIANVTLEGPSKTVTGGRYSNPLIKFGKSARLEMQEALGRADAIQALGGGVIEQFHGDSNNDMVLHMTENFAGPKTIIGDSFFIDQKSGAQVKVKIVFYQFLPDSIMNLTQDAEGDATVFDLNGDLLTTEILVGQGQDYADGGIVTGVFYSILPEAEIVAVTE